MSIWAYPYHADPTLDRIAARTSDGKIWECDECPCLCRTEFFTSYAVTVDTGLPAEFASGVIVNSTPNCLFTSVCVWSGYAFRDPPYYWIQLDSVAPFPPFSSGWSRLRLYTFAGTAFFGGYPGCGSVPGTFTYSEVQRFGVPNPVGTYSFGATTVTVS